MFVIGGNTQVTRHILDQSIIRCLPRVPLQLSDNSAAEKKKIEDFLVEDPWMESLKELSNACTVDQVS